MALATIEDVKAVMARSLTDEDVRRMPRLLDIASARVRTFTGIDFARATTTTRLRVRNGRVRLPQPNVSAVSAVADVNANPVTFTWDAGRVVDCNPTLLNEFEINLRRARLQWVDVTYTHGYDPVPADVVGVVCDMVAVALDAPPENGGLQSSTVGPWTDTYRASYPGVMLTQTMKDTLTNYMTPVGTASIT